MVHVKEAKRQRRTNSGWKTSGMTHEWVKRWSDGDIAYVWLHDPEHPRQITVPGPWVWEYLTRSEGPIARGSVSSQAEAISEVAAYRRKR